MALPPWSSSSNGTFRWGSPCPGSLLAVLALLFIIPHDPSTVLLSQRHRPGSEAFCTAQPAFRATSLRRSPGARALAPERRLPASLTPRDGGGRSVLARVRDAAATVQRGDLGPNVFLGRVRASCSTMARQLARARRWSPPEEELAAAALEEVALKAAALEVAGLEAAAAFAAGNATAPLIPTTVAELREQHGERQRWWGDLGPADARALYHQLLPFDLLDDDHSLPLAERARLAVSARHAARLYVRERALLPVTLLSGGLDGVRQLLERGSFQTEGLTESQVWEKYAAKFGMAPHELEEQLGSCDGLYDGALDEVFATILQKSCTPNRHVDFLAGGAAASEKHAALLEEMGAARDADDDCDLPT